MMNRKLYILAFLLIFCIPKFGYTLEKWDQIHEDILNNMPKIELKDKNNRDQLIALYEIGEKQEIVSAIDSYLDKKYDTILMSIYLSYTLFYNRTELPFNTQKRLDEFRVNEANKNSIPDFLTSYYHFLKSDYHKSLSFLKSANKTNIYKDFTQERKIITFNYLMEMTKNKIYSYSNSSFISTEIPSLLLHMSHKMKSSSQNAFKKELTIYATSINKVSLNLYSLTASIYAMTDCVDKVKYPDLYASLEKEKEQLPRFTNFIHDSLKEAEGKDEFIKYLEIAYKSGELKALNMFFPYQYDPNIDTQKELQKMIMRMKILYDQTTQMHEPSDKSQSEN